MTTPFDLALPARDLPVPEALEMAAAAERDGWSGVWLSEVLDIDALAMAAAIAATTARLRIGTAIVPITTRSAATLAMAASTIARLAPRRFHLGVGVSTPALVADRHDRPVTRPLSQTRGTVEVLRSALAGKRVDHDANPAVLGLSIVAPPAPPPVLVAALGPRMTALAVEVADGLVLNLLPDDLAVQRATAARDVRGDAFETVLLMRTIVDPTDGEIAALHREVAGYVRVDAYGRSLDQAGLDVAAARRAGSLDAATAALGCEVVEALTVLGPATRCRDRLESLQDRGVTPLVVPAGGAEAARRTMDALRPDAHPAAP